MSFLDNIRNKTHAQKVRLIWIICTACVILLALVWLFTTRIGKNMPKDTSLFKTITNSLKSLK